MNWAEHEQYLLKSNSEIKTLQKLYTEKKIMNLSKAPNERRQHFPISQKH